MGCLFPKTQYLLFHLQRAVADVVPQKEAGDRDVTVIPTPFQEAIATNPSAYRR
jgi:hypothetical protein